MPRSEPPHETQKGPRTPRLVGLNFKVEDAFRRSFKVEAATRGLSLKQLLEECWQSYLVTRAPARRSGAKE